MDDIDVGAFDRITDGFIDGDNDGDVVGELLSSKE